MLGLLGFSLLGEIIGFLVLDCFSVLRAEGGRLFLSENFEPFTLSTFVTLGDGFIGLVLRAAFTVFLPAAECFCVDFFCACFLAKECLVTL